MTAPLKMYEVRCCCQPEKLLGYLPAPEGVYSWRWPYLQPVDWSRITQPEQADYKAGFIELPIQHICFGWGHWPAIKAEGMTIEQLRNIVGFRER